jgi:hypothetical protein
VKVSHESPAARNVSVVDAANDREVLVGVSLDGGGNDVLRGGGQT